MKLDKLETFNVRNSPTAMTKWLPFNCMLESLAAKFVDFAMIKLRRSNAIIRLKTIAIGSITYADVFVGGNVKCLTAHDYLRLRVFRVGHRSTHDGEKVIALDLIAEGTSDDAEGIVDNLGILKPYWLR